MHTEIIHAYLYGIRFYENPKTMWTRCYTLTQIMDNYETIHNNIEKKHITFGVFSLNFKQIINWTGPYLYVNKGIIYNNKKRWNISYKTKWAWINIWILLNFRINTLQVSIYSDKFNHTRLERFLFTLYITKTNSSFSTYKKHLTYIL